MNILLNLKNKFNKKNLDKLGGIEVLNVNLFSNLKRKYKNIYFKGNPKIKYNVIIGYAINKSKYSPRF